MSVKFPCSAFSDRNTTSSEKDGGRWYNLKNHHQNRQAELKLRLTKKRTPLLSECCLNKERLLGTGVVLWTTTRPRSCIFETLRTREPTAFVRFLHLRKRRPTGIALGVLNLRKRRQTNPRVEGSSFQGHGPTVGSFGGGIEHFIPIPLCIAPWRGVANTLAGGSQSTLVPWRTAECGHTRTLQIIHHLFTYIPTLFGF